MAPRKKNDEAPKPEAKEAVPATEAEDKGAKPEGEATPAPAEATETDRLSAEAKVTGPAPAPETPLGRAPAREAAPTQPEEPVAIDAAAASALAQSEVPFAGAGYVVVVLGPKKGRWRAKRHFGAEPVRIPADELTDEQKEQLLSDPQLVVTVTEAGSPL